jgi:hypothetical protein
LNSVSNLTELDLGLCNGVYTIFARISRNPQRDRNPWVHDMVCEKQRVSTKKHENHEKNDEDPAISLSCYFVD